MMELCQFSCLVILLTIAQEHVFAKLSLASYYGDNMVLQRAPKSSKIWGYADKLGEMVIVTVGNHPPPVTTRVVWHDALKRNIWSVMLPPISEYGPTNITVTSIEGSLVINQVMFGDVWVCSGQSNMQFTLSMVINASQEVADAHNYPNIRVFTAAQKWSNTTLYDLVVQEPWSQPNNDSVGHSDWTYFSAVCWLYGKYLYKQLNYPIGLIATTWGGTPIEAWSSKDAMNKCNTEESISYGLPRDEHGNFDLSDQNTPTHLWNAMVHPFLNLTIYGAIWYQGEANAGAPDSYKCRFPAMITDWRQKFNIGSGGQTDINFPFGFVQLAPYRNDSTIVQGFPDIRWHQTSDYGYVPNPIMPQTFMSVAIDLPDFTSTYGSIHPRYKQDVAARLVLAALPVAYKITTMGRFQGPKVTAYFIDTGFHTLTLELDGGQSPITVKTIDGFEVCCSRNNQSKCDGKDSTWILSPIAKYFSTNVTISSCIGQFTMGVRYLWRESPCAFKMCAIYSVENALPMAPFIEIGLIGRQDEQSASRYQ